jgi:hypothetical protein
MIPTTLKTLSETPPPNPKKKLRTWREVSSRIAEIEGLLGVPQSKPIYNLLAAHEVLERLEAMLSTGEEASPERTPLAAVAPTAPAPVASSIISAAIPAAKAAPVAELRGRGRTQTGILIEGANRQPRITEQPPAAVLPIRGQAAAPVVSQAVESFSKMSGDARATFSQDGKALSLEAFDKLSPAAKIQHLTLGGKLQDSEGFEARDYAPDRPGGTRGLNYAATISLSVFQKLGLNSQVLMLRHGARVGRG